MQRTDYSIWQAIGKKDKVVGKQKIKKFNLLKSAH